MSHTFHHDDQGREVPDPTPAPVPGWVTKAVSRHDSIKAYVRSVLAMEAEAQGFETFEEADDFDVDEEPDPFSPYEIQEAAPEWPGGVKDADGDPPTDPHGKTAPKPEKGPARASAEGRVPDQPAGRGDSAAVSVPPSGSS